MPTDSVEPLWNNKFKFEIMALESSILINVCRLKWYTARLKDMMQNGYQDSNSFCTIARLEEKMNLKGKNLNIKTSSDFSF